MGMFDGLLGGIVGAGMVSVVNNILEQHGGVQGVVNQFERNGLGSTVRSWVASHPVSLARALLQRSDGAPVLIDTAGADLRDPAQEEELRGLAAAAGAEIALVLPCGLDPAEAAELALAHAECGATSLIVTRLDLARRLGSVIAAAAASRLPRQAAR